MSQNCQPGQVVALLDFKHLLCWLWQAPSIGVLLIQTKNQEEWEAESIEVKVDSRNHHHLYSAIVTSLPHISLHHDDIYSAVNWTNTSIDFEYEYENNIKSYIASIIARSEDTNKTIK